ncbi:hypothetical protein LU226_06615 [Pantoea sp. Pb-8]|uniref:hypothetical protein n=1 Tax=Pantoea sp. Pb-8 TaxID=2904118 RepID=UPI001E435EFC|nr:hypothetical protein [Pantoea sp. Pb-8]MCE0501065.1 hypothetical protein [Pantoea sp. Pb-8]
MGKSLLFRQTKNNALALAVISSTYPEPAFYSGIAPPKSADSSKSFLLGGVTVITKKETYRLIRHQAACTNIHFSFAKLFGYKRSVRLHIYLLYRLVFKHAYSILLSCQYHPSSCW